MSRFVLIYNFFYILDDLNYFFFSQIEACTVRVKEKAIRAEKH